MAETSVSGFTGARFSMLSSMGLRRENEGQICTIRRLSHCKRCVATLWTWRPTGGEPMVKRRRPCCSSASCRSRAPRSGASVHGQAPSRATSRSRLRAPTAHRQSVASNDPFPKSHPPQKYSRRLHQIHWADPPYTAPKRWLLSGFPRISVLQAPYSQYSSILGRRRQQVV